MSQIETTKLTMAVHLGPDAGNAVVPKLNMYVRLVPGDGGDSGVVRFSHVYAQKIRRG